MVEYGLVISNSLGSFLHRLTYDHTLWTTMILVIAAVSIIIYGISKL